jgi:hypothetical protein
LASGFVAILLGIAIGGLYWASQQVPAFYPEVLSQDRATAQQASDGLLRSIAALVSDIRKSGPWQALLTAEEINGWLSYDLVRNHPRLFPASISDPRVAVEQDRLKIAFHWQRSVWSAIVFLETEVYLRAPNIVAVRICKARAGMLPLPLRGVLDELIASGREIGLEIDEQQFEGDPLLLITLPLGNGAREDSFCLESLELNSGEIYLAGRSQREGVGKPSLARRPREPQERASEAQAEKQNLQR